VAPATYVGPFRRGQRGLVEGQLADVFATLRVDEPYYDRAKSELYSISPSGGEPTKINAFDMDE
jgi:hypothetical protein